MDKISIDQAKIINVIVSIVILTKNDNKLNEISLWSEILQCPITTQQRYNQISYPLKQYLLKTGKK